MPETADRRLKILRRARRALIMAGVRDNPEAFYDALLQCHHAMRYMSEYDIPITLPDQVRETLELVGPIPEEP